MEHETGLRLITTPKPQTTIGAVINRICSTRMCSVRACRALIAAKIRLLCSVTIPFLGAFAAAGASISLEWNPSSSANVVGYSIFYGVASHQYTFSLDAGTNTTITVSGLVDGQTYYFATIAYDSEGGESSYSNELVDSVPFSPAPVTPIIPATWPSPDAIAYPGSTDCPDSAYSSDCPRGARGPDSSAPFAGTDAAFGASFFDGTVSLGRTTLAKVGPYDDCCHGR
jgi:hypothetical protein